ncbi:ribose 5-phosphate isomerase B [Candidatus Woesearchaeota archaeon]|nr:ribose 5-phosphate isomerase B [Candidatus Woesearchaeota archaeon]
MKIIIGADHGGFELKKQLNGYLTESGHEVEDVGNFEMDPDDDYPNICFSLTKKVVETGGRGILVCGTGIGMSIAANRIKGIRAALVHNESTAKMSREHNDSNVLCLGGRILDSELAKKIVKTWLETEFTGGRHKRRIDKMENGC